MLTGRHTSADPRATIPIVLTPVGFPRVSLSKPIAPPMTVAAVRRRRTSIQSNMGYRTSATFTVKSIASYDTSPMLLTITGTPCGFRVPPRWSMDWTTVELILTTKQHPQCEPRACPTQVAGVLRDTPATESDGFPPAVLME